MIFKIELLSSASRSIKDDEVASLSVFVNRIHYSTELVSQIELDFYRKLLRRDAKVIRAQSSSDLGFPGPCPVAYVSHSLRPSFRATDSLMWPFGSGWRQRTSISEGPCPGVSPRSILTRESVASPCPEFVVGLAGCPFSARFRDSPCSLASPERRVPLGSTRLPGTALNIRPRELLKPLGRGWQP